MKRALKNGLWKSCCFLCRFVFLNFERVWEALWAFLVALGALWDDFFSFNDIFTTFHLQALGCHLGLILLRFWRVLGSFFEILDLLAEEMLELISNLKLKLRSSSFELEF